VDKRRLWREQEQKLVDRWNAAEARHRDVHAEISRLPPGSADDGASRAELLLRAEAARLEIETLRREVARMKVEFNSGKRY
jgi:hypothetical protein